MTGEGTDEFWGITNLAVTGHDCPRHMFSRLTAASNATFSNPWVDDLVDDEMNGWSLPNLVLWTEANNGNKYHGM